MSTSPTKEKLPWFPDNRHFSELDDNLLSFDDKLVDLLAKT